MLLTTLLFQAVFVDGPNAPSGKVERDQHALQTAIIFEERGKLCDRLWKAGKPFATAEAEVLSKTELYGDLEEARGTCGVYLLARMGALEDRIDEIGAAPTKSRR